MKRLIKFLKITGRDAAIFVGVIALVVAGMAAAGGILFGIVYGIGVFSNDVVFSGEPLTTELYFMAGIAFSVLIGLPCFLLFLVTKAIIFICRWIADNWRQSGAWR